MAVSIRNVSKKYKLFKSPRERFYEALHPFKKKYHSEFWALRDINLEIPCGQTVGIIGRNGSGKSTLLQIIAGVLQSTEGRMMTQGKVAALLELGTGFNVEMSGRENVLLYGAIAGFSPGEMKERLPLVEAFADLGSFIMQPVKTYSSGMFIRLAFAAAIFTNPDILIVDEALAVGDAKFQQKCYRRFSEFQEAGKTILLATHDLSVVTRHCDRVVVIDQGAVVYDGAPKDAVHRYLDLLEGREKGLSHNGAESFVRAGASEASEGATELDRFLAELPAVDQCARRRSYNSNEYRQHDPQRRCEILDYLIVRNGVVDPTSFHSGDWVDLYVKAQYSQPVEHPLFGVAVKTVNGLMVYALNSFFNRRFLPSAAAGDMVVFKFRFQLNVNHGDYFLDLGLDEKTDDLSYACMERRNAIIHVIVLERNRFHGIADLLGDCEEVRRLRAASSDQFMMAGMQR